jgi:hypothetical protein
MSTDIQIIKPYRNEITFLSGGTLWSGTFDCRDNATWKPNTVSTVPLKDGRYVNPTPWKAFYCNVKRDLCTYRYRYAPDHGYNMRFTGYPLESEVNNYIQTYGCGSLWPHEPVVPASVISDSVNAAKNKIRNSNWNIGQSLAELPETAAFVLKTAMRIFTAYKAARRLNWNKVRKILNASHTSRSKSVASGWLEYSYAWKPLIGDAYNVAKLLEDGLKEPSFTATSRVLDKTFTAPTLNPGSYGSLTGTFKRGCVTSYTFRVADPLIFDLERSGLMNPASTTWELIPFSFVIDWFYNLGALLDSLSLGFGLSFVNGYQTQFVSVDWNAEYHVYGHHDPDGSRRSISGQTRSMTRIVLNVWPHPTPYFRGFGNLGLSKAISLLALAIQRA